jgi:hypothetical protein
VHVKNLRYRPYFLAAIALAGIWALALAAYSIAQNAKMTPEKLQAYFDSVHFEELSAADRFKAIHEFADRINALSAEDRQRWRSEFDWKTWFATLTENERGEFIEAALPTGFKQMLDRFAAMPEDQRRRLIDNALKDLRENRGGPPARNVANYGTNGPPPISPELEHKVRVLGLNTFYRESSAETKAELAPLLEELEQQMRARGFH